MAFFLLFHWRQRMHESRVRFGVGETAGVSSAQDALLHINHSCPQQALHQRTCCFEWSMRTCVVHIVWVGLVIRHGLQGHLPWQGPSWTAKGHVLSPHKKGLSPHWRLVHLFSSCPLFPRGHRYSQGFQSVSLSFFRAEHFRSKEMIISRPYFKSY